MTKPRKTSALRPPETKEAPRATDKKIERALEVRKSSSEARQGKPLAFPTHRLNL